MRENETLPDISFSVGNIGTVRIDIVGRLADITVLIPLIKSDQIKSNQIMTITL
jgi:hypothetical protein